VLKNNRYDGDQVIGMGYGQPASQPPNTQYAYGRSNESKKEQRNIETMNIENNIEGEIINLPFEFGLPNCG
jgi:hypothetical protein